MSDSWMSNRFVKLIDMTIRWLKIDILGIRLNKINITVDQKQNMNSHNTAAIEMSPGPNKPIAPENRTRFPLPSGMITNQASYRKAMRRMGSWAR